MCRSSIRHIDQRMLSYERVLQNNWDDNSGREVPIFRRLAADLGLKTFVELGTNFGQKISRLRDDFTEIHTIELNPALHARAARAPAPRAGRTIP